VLRGATRCYTKHSRYGSLAVVHQGKHTHIHMRKNTKTQKHVLTSTPCHSGHSAIRDPAAFVKIRQRDREINKYTYQYLAPQ
jgi:hypothetical protein